MQVTSSLGGYGHPNICRRPCILFLRGRCEKAQDCGFCHMHHETQQKFRSKFPFPGSSQTPSWESFSVVGQGPFQDLMPIAKFPWVLSECTKYPGCTECRPSVIWLLDCPGFKTSFLRQAATRFSQAPSSSELPWDDPTICPQARGG